VRVHVKLNTGMNRFGVHWKESLGVLEAVHASSWLSLEGVMSHFSMSDETDKSFAHLQLGRFREVLDQMQTRGLKARWRHLANSGGYLDLPQAHFDMVRIGILALGVYPSEVCRRIPGIEPVMQVKSRVATIQSIQQGDNVGYGLRYTASGPRRIGVLPIGYGDGFPRLRNLGHVLVRGCRAPVVGANAMDALMVDLTDIPRAQPWDEAVLMGRQGELEITIHDIARWGNTVSYDALCGWRSRLPRVYTSPQTTAL
jgi:alanine racemase